MQNDKTRLFYLDAMRGIAALMVVFSHYIERTPVHQFWLFEFFTPGQFGVVVFFMLSGFVIPYSFKHGSGEIHRFIISRFFRLYPAYWVSVLLAVISAAIFIKSPMGISTIVANMTMIQKILGYPDAFGVYWTLLVELFFYFICVVTAIMGWLASLKAKFYLSLFFLSVGLVASVIRYLSGIPMPVGIVVSVSIMFFGSVWREVVINHCDVAKRYSIAWLFLFFIIFPLISFLVYDFDRGLGESAYSYIGSFFFGIVFFLIFTSKIKLNCRYLVFLGVVSYSIYLMHPFILEFVNFKVDLGVDFNPLIFIVYVMTVLMLSSVSYLLIEKPSIRLGKIIKSRIAISNTGDVRDSI